MKLTNLELRNESKLARLMNVCLPPLALAICVLFTTLFFSYYGRIHMSSLGAENYFSCNPNGTVRFPWDDVYARFVGSGHAIWLVIPSALYWDRSSFLSITLGVGSFDFAGAKAVDIAWDLVIGRGGQLLLVAIFYPVFRNSVLFCLERRSMTLEGFATVTISKVSLESALTLTRGLSDTQTHHSDRAPTDAIKLRGVPLEVLHKSWHATVGRCSHHVNWTFLGLTLASIYTLVFPTFVSAMTGYQALNTAYITLPGSLTLEKASNLLPYDMAVSDGRRIGLTSPYGVNWTSQWGLFDTLSNYQKCSIEYAARYCGASETARDIPQECFAGNLSDPDYPFSFAPEPNFVNVSTQNIGVCMDAVFFGNRLESSFNTSGRVYTLPPPLLDISLSDGPDAVPLYSAGDNITVTREWMIAPGHSYCLPDDTYQWGFSFMMLFCFCIATALFVCVVAALHWNNEWRSRASRYKQHFSLYRDALDLSLELRALGDRDVENMSAKELDEYVKQCRGAVRLELDSLRVPSLEESSITDRIRRAAFRLSKPLQWMRRLAGLLPGFKKKEKKDPAVAEEEMALWSKAPDQPVFEGT